MSHAQANADVFRAIADPARRAILGRLRNGPAQVNALAQEFARSRQAISKYFRVLHALGWESWDFADHPRDTAATGVWGGAK